MPAVICGSCHRMCDEQCSVKCMGPCAAHYHFTCVNIGTVERDFFIVDGVSVYKCHNCSRRRNDDTCVTPVASHQKVEAGEPCLLPAQNKHTENNLECLLPAQNKHTENNLECSLADKLEVLQENCDSMVLLMKEILNKTGQISTDLGVLKSENVALKCLLSEFLKENKSCSCMKSDSVISLTKFIQLSSQSATDSCADGSSQGYVAAEDLHFKTVHKEIRLRGSEFPSPQSKPTEKILKMEAQFNSGVSASGLKPKMKALLGIKANEELLKKMTVSRTFPWKTGSFLLLFAIVALLSYDIKKHGSFHSSSTAHFLNDIGALQYGEHAWARTTFYSKESYHWAEANVPHYYKLAGEHAKPYLELAWDFGVVAGHQLHKMYENIYAYVEEKTPVVIEWINSYAPGLLDKVKEYSIEAWEQMKKNALILWQFFIQYLSIGLEWVKANVFVGSLSPENLQKYSMEALNTTQVYAVWTYDWVCQKVQTLSKIQ